MQMPLPKQLDPIVQDMRETGFARAPSSQMRALLPADALADWSSFAQSWGDLGVDAYMADNGRYRRRRFSAFAVTDDSVSRKPHQPHYQSRDYNLLNGGIERWFDPFKDEIAAHPALSAILQLCFTLFDALTPAGAATEVMACGVSPVPHRGACRRAGAADTRRSAP